MNKQVQMSAEEVVKRLIEYNVWRRGGEREMPHPGKIGIVLDAAIALLSAGVAQAEVQQATVSQSDDLVLFARWKNYPLPDLNSDGRFDAEWLQREFIAFKAGRLQSPSTNTVRQDDGKDWLNIDAAAKKLADCMDYPWERMPEEGRQNMRIDACSIVDAAISSMKQKGE